MMLRGGLSKAPNRQVQTRADSYPYVTEYWGKACFPVRLADKKRWLI